VKLYFNEFVLDEDSGILRGPSGEIKLRPKTFSLLLVFLKSQGKLLEKASLIELVWDVEFVTDGSLAREISDLRRAVGDDRNNPRFIETLHRRGYRFIADVHSGAPPSRQIDSSDCLVDEEIGPLKRGDSQSGRRKVLGAGALIVLVIMVWLVVSVLFNDDSEKQPRKAIAVLGFRNFSGNVDDAWLSAALADMLTTELGEGLSLRTIPEEMVVRMKTDLNLEIRDTYAQGALVSIRRYLGVNYVVVGSYRCLEKKADGRLRLDIKVQQTTTGETVFSFAETGSREGLPDLVTACGQRLRLGLGDEELSPVEAANRKASLPSRPEVVRLYSEGLAKLRLLEPAQARALLEGAVAAEPDFPLAHAALADACFQLGYEEKARKEAINALRLANRLPRLDRLLVEGRSYEVAREWEKAIGAFRSLWSLSPDTIEYGLNLGRAQVFAGNPQDALATVEELRRLPPSLAEDPRIDVLEARAARTLSNFKLQARCASIAAKKAEARGATLLSARAMMLETEAHWGMDNTEKALTAFRNVRRVFAAAGDLRGEAMAVHDMACMMWIRGRGLQADELFQESLELHRRRGDQQEIARTLNSIALMKLESGDPEAARPAFAESLTIRRKLHDTRGIGIALLGTGTVLVCKGHLRQAEEAQLEALSLFRLCGDRPGQGYALSDHGDVLLESGRPEAAAVCFKASLEIFRGLPHFPWIVRELYRLAMANMLQGDLGAARVLLAEASSILVQHDDFEVAAELSLIKAELDLINSLPEKALHKARAAETLLINSRAVSSLVRSREMLSRILVSLGKVDAAEIVITETIPLLPATSDARLRYRLAITRARILMSRGAVDKAAILLDDMLREMRHNGCMWQELVARIERAELYVKIGDTAAGQALAKAARSDAQACGLHMGAAFEPAMRNSR